MRKVVKLAALSILATAPALYGASIAACTGCHGQQFEKVAMGKSKVVKDMSKEDIIAAMKGYKDGTYGGPMKGLMKSQVAKLDDAAIEGIAALIKGSTATPTDKATEHAAAAAVAESKVIDINKKACDPKRINKEDLGKKTTVSEEALGLRKTDLYAENQDTEGVQADYKRPAPGASTRFERAFVNAPPMIPHDVEGMLPITTNNNQCIGCHMPEPAKSMGAIPIPESHFTNFRPKTVMEGNKVVKEGKELGKANTSDVLVAKAEHMKTLYQGRFNCSQCHAPQANIDTVVGNTFQPDFKDEKGKASSNLMDIMNEGVQ
ncbi:MAG: nitrate reductase cytochrome c-type subunit [Sulfurimonas sp.]